MEFNTNEYNQILQTINSGHLTHAYIIDGAEGVGKRTFAKAMAKAILCTGEKKPCGVCRACIKADEDSHPDLYIYESDNSVKVDDIRAIKKSVALLPNDGDKKVYIIANAEKMTRNAQNAMLKFFEEPPQSAVFLILTQKKEALLPTVLSRGQRITLGCAPTERIETFLLNKYKKKDISDIQSAARMSDGSVGKAIELLSKDSLTEKKHAFNFIALLMNKNTRRFDVQTDLLPVNKIKRESMLLFLSFVQQGLRDIASAKAGGSNGMFFEMDIASKYARSCSLEYITYAWNIIVETICAVEDNANLTATITDMCNKLTSDKKTA